MYGEKGGGKPVRVLIIQTTWKGMPPVSPTKGEQNGKKSSRKD